MTYRLIATDIDGTLLNESHEVTPRTRQAVAELQRRGVTLVLTTARPPRAIRHIYDDLGLNGPVIAYNGALVYDPAHDRPLLHHPIHQEAALAIVAAIRAAAPELNLGLELMDEWHVDRVDEHLQWILDTNRVAAPIFGDVARAIETTRRKVSKIYFLAPAHVRRAVEERLPPGVSVTSSGMDFVEIHAAGVDKGAALRALGAILGIPREATLALGDGENDIPLLQAAGLSVAMGNAAETVRRAAGAVTEPNTAEGWARAIERYVLAVGE
ncbi:MAG TPA: Cof-type HAD-IIB family hydrolase [Symbiobacteriaceae bacterium]|nr:Cof-type HAD-IIB family hydrolase [Symbiobacteriaceae bacterium]